MTTKVAGPEIGHVEPVDYERRTMNSIASGTVLITGPTGGLGRGQHWQSPIVPRRNGPTSCWWAGPVTR
jgi:hypothetical protein